MAPMIRIRIYPIRFHLVAIAILALVTPALLASCGDSVNGPGDEEQVWEEQRSDLSRNMSPSPTPEDLAQLVQGNHEFACNLLTHLRAESGDENLLVSPLSIRIAFAQAYAGARGTTEEEIAQTLRYLPEGQVALHQAFNALDLALGKRNLPMGNEGEDPVELHIANSFWGKTGYPFLDSYLDVLAVNYGAAIRSLDFLSDPEGARKIINSWIEDRTRSRIRDLLPPQALEGPVVAVLTNALYFKAPWDLPFDVQLTRQGTFFVTEDNPVAVDMMHQLESFAYAEGENYQALELVFRGKELSMVLLLPARDAFEAFAAQMDAGQLGRILSDLAPADVEVTLPKFTSEASFKLKDTLRDMGMGTPFTVEADFSGMVSGRDVWIDEAYHKTFISVDEKGAEAAAATAIVMVERGGGGDHEFIADRPFLYLIRDRETGVILFLGQVMNPVG
ncbi:MAG: serpin family protein [Candidatus Eisenbacteria sp.]|nr:serpin family protein [Candidatus Eisenbacteria bacterium]